MSFLNRRKEPEISQSPVVRGQEPQLLGQTIQVDFIPQETRPLYPEQHIQPQSAAEIITIHAQDLTDYAEARRDAKLLVAEARQPEWGERWKDMVVDGVTQMGLRSEGRVDRSERRKNRAFMEGWDDHVAGAIMAARMTTNLDALRNAEVRQHGINTPAVNVEGVLSYYNNEYKPDDYAPSDMLTLYSMERTLFSQLVGHFVREEEAAAGVLTSVINYAGQDINRWEEVAELAGQHVQDAVHGKQTPGSTFVRILAEDLHDPQRGHMERAINKSKQTSEAQLLQLLVGSLEDGKKLSSQEAHTKVAIEFAAALTGLKTDDPEFSIRLLAARKSWPEALAKEFDGFSSGYFEAILDDMKQPTLRLASSFSRLPKAEQLLTVMGLVAEAPANEPKRKAIMNGMSPKNLLEAAETAEPEPAFTFLMGSPTKEAVPFTNEKEQALINEMGLQLGGGEAIKSDLQRILAAFKNDPFEKGTTPISEIGVVTIPHNGTKIKGRVYRINVPHRPGLSTSTPIAKDVRVLFVNSGENIVLIGVFKHDDYEATIKTLRK